MTESHYRVAEGDLSQGDICFVYLAHTRARGESPPGNEYDTSGRVPAYPEVATFRLPDDLEVVTSLGFALVVTHSCELDRQKNAEVPEEHWDCRIGVAPIVPITRAPELNWESISADRNIGLFYLQGADRESVGSGIPPEDWPTAFADLRGITVTSRRLVSANRLMRLSPERLAQLQFDLARFFVWREPSRISVIEELVGRKIAGVTTLSSKKANVAVVADDGSVATLRIEARE